MTKKTKNKNSIFDQMMTGLINDEISPEVLEDCMSFDMDLIKKIPLRYRIIALGFLKKMSLDELNQDLEKNGCARLYSRSVWEASLIYAFSNGLSYAEWKPLLKECSEVHRRQEDVSPYFRNRSISVKDLRDYIADNSDEDMQIQRTRHLTQRLQEQMLAAVLGKSDFRSFLMENIQSFSTVREKTRYYFCKYLEMFLRTRADRYLEALADDSVNEQVMMDLAVFKGVTKLKRKKMTPEDAKEFLEQVDISCGEIFDAFNYFYFDYVSTDWMHVLIEYYGDLDLLPKDIKGKLAASLRTYKAKEYGKLSDEEAIERLKEEMEEEERMLDAAYSSSGSTKGYGRNRAGENAVRKYIKGAIDIDRTSFLCFLLFFGNEADLPEEMALTQNRLNQILIECGFPGLRGGDAFDFFVIQFLHADDPVDYLMNEVTDYALKEENFYLYKTYTLSESYAQEFSSVME